MDRLSFRFLGGHSHQFANELLVEIQRHAHGPLPRWHACIVCSEYVDIKRSQGVDSLCR